METDLGLRLANFIVKILSFGRLLLWLLPDLPVRGPVHRSWPIASKAPETAVLDKQALETLLRSAHFSGSEILASLSGRSVCAARDRFVTSGLQSTLLLRTSRLLFRHLLATWPGSTVQRVRQTPRQICGSERQQGLLEKPLIISVVFIRIQIVL